MGLFDLFTSVGTEYQHIENKEFQSLVERAGFENVSIIDVRTSGEYQNGHILKAINLNVMSPDFTRKIEKLDKGRAHYIICASGNRSKTACGIMAKKGFANVFNVKAGMMGWSGLVE